MKDQVTGTDGNDSFNDAQTSPNAFDQAVERWQARTTESFTPLTGQDLWSGPQCGYLNDYTQPDLTVDKTVYQLIMESKHTTIFARLINENEDIVALLNSTASNRYYNFTIFVPIDSAFEKVKALVFEMPKQYMELFVAYHFASRAFSAHCLLRKHTIPSTLAASDLAVHRLSINLQEWTVNNHSRIIAADIVSTCLFGTS